MDSMKTHCLNRIIFGMETLELVGAINKPNVWLSYHYHAGEIYYKLKKNSERKVVNEIRTTNRRAFL